MLHGSMTRRPRVQPQGSVISLAALVTCLRQANAQNDSRFSRTRRSSLPEIDPPPLHRVSEPAKP
jgi:hypothetical protein